MLLLRWGIFSLCNGIGHSGNVVPPPKAAATTPTTLEGPPQPSEFPGGGVLAAGKTFALQLEFHPVSFPGMTPPDCRHSPILLFPITVDHGILNVTSLLPNSNLHQPFVLSN